MNSVSFLLIIITVALVTYPLRLVPAVFISKLKLSTFFERLLDLIPYTSLTALVFPGIFYCIGDHTYIAYAGTVAAVISSFLRAPLSLTVVIAVVTVFVLLVL
ncbi:MAG: AzlD domain-containing protein [Succinivibrio sp.]|nr:AzlD domain-containing protein [Succinivibrio sp.]